MNSQIVSSCPSFLELDHLPSGPVRFYIEGLKCHHCLGKLRNLEKDTPAIKKLSVNMGSKTLVLDIDRNQLSLSKFAEKLADKGFQIQPLNNFEELESKQVAEKRTQLVRLGISFAVSANIMLFSLSNYLGAEDIYQTIFDWISGTLFLPVLLYCAYPFYKNLLTKNIDLNAPIALAIMSGSAISYYHLFTFNTHVYFDSLSVLVTLLLGSRFLLWSIQNKFLQSKSLLSFINLNEIEVIDSEGNKTSRPVSEIQLGELVIVPPRSTLPFDGKLSSNSAYLNVAVITGESKPVKFQKHDVVHAGSMTSDSAITMQTTSTLQNSRLSQLVSDLEEELQKPSSWQLRGDRWAKHFVMGMTTLSAALLFYFFWAGNFQEGLERALALVILACPCSLALAIPLSQALILKNSSHEGIFFKNTETLERMGKIKNVVFDKTGTLTEGSFKFLGWQNTQPSEHDLSIIYSLEEKSQHPMGRAIYRYLESQNLNKVDVESFKEEPGKGVEGKFEGKHYRVGPLKHNDDHNSSFGFYVDGQLKHQGQMGDEAKPELANTLKKLHGNYNTFLMTGDQKNPALQLGNEAGFQPKNIIYGVTPDQKVQKIKELDNTLMIGDGANDALALAHADVGIAVAGSLKVSLKASDVYLTNPDVNKINRTFHWTNVFDKATKRNLLFSLAYNFFGAIASILGFVTPLFAAVLMPIASIIVVTMTLLGTKK